MPWQKRKHHVILWYVSHWDVIKESLTPPLSELNRYISTTAMSNPTEPSETSREGVPDSTMQSDIERRNIFQNISADANVFQFIGSTNGHTTTARHITAQQYATQCMGDLSDSSLRQISMNRSAIAAKKQTNHDHKTGCFDGPGYKLR